jgi:hypothetical protein
MFIGPTTADMQLTKEILSFQRGVGPGLQYGEVPNCHDQMHGGLGGAGHHGVPLSNGELSN